MWWGSSSPAPDPFSKVSEFLQILAGTDPIEESDDNIWNIVLSISDPLCRFAQGRWNDVVRENISGLVQNSNTTRNVQTFLSWTAARLEALQVTMLTNHGLSNVIYLQRLCVGMMMTDYSSDLKGILASDGKGGSSLVDRMTASSITALLEVCDQGTLGVKRSLEGDVLEMELLKFIITLCIFEGNGLLKDEMGVLDSCMKSPGMDKLACVLLHRWIHATKETLPKAWVEEDGDVCTQESALSSMTKTFVSLPWQATSMLTRTADDANPQDTSNLYPSADLLCFAILIFYYHESSAKKAVPNVFRESVKTIQDGSKTQDHTMISFPMFVDTIGSRLSASESSALLLYTVLQGNSSFYAYCMARTDVDIIMVPILQLLMDFEKRSLTHVYILMIIMLIFSEEPSLAQNSGDIVLKSVSFYKARQLKNIKLDSLMYLVLLHVAHYNMLTTKDMYLQTNTLATLANVGPAIRDLHPIACQKLLNTLEKVNDRLDKIENSDGTVNHSFGPLDVQLASDFVNIILEVLNAMIVHNISSNANLLYSLMHKKECIDKIRAKSQYRDVSENIGRVVEYFAERIERKSQAHHGSPLTSEAIQDVIQDSIKEWRSSALKPSVDLKFSYEEEARNSEFFIPCILDMIKKSPCIPIK
ncbi:hypothetical protein M9435_000102 [Picochlorum sp. BPE23]|nr:hypothetical protein M9435_000102 [Picochlorum sp. BPE23]